MGGDPKKINPLVPCDLVIDHSVQVDEFGTALALSQNVALSLNGTRNAISSSAGGNGPSITSVSSAARRESSTKSISSTWRKLS